MDAFILVDGKKVFNHGDNAIDLARDEALKCKLFKRDYEEECMYEDEITCYNCQYRRWTETGFICMKG